MRGRLAYHVVIALLAAMLAVTMYQDLQNAGRLAVCRMNCGRH